MAMTPRSGAGQALIGVTLSMLALSWITVGMRIWVRKVIKALGIDDLLMLLGVILFTLAAASIIFSAYNGIGTRDEYLNEYYYREGRKWFWGAQVIYPLATLAIKCSICTCMLRFTKQRRYRLSMYIIMLLTCIASLTTSVTLLAWCKPIAANWDAAAGTCPDSKILTNVSYYMSANSILTDWACAILPAFVLWDVQLKTRLKVSIIMLLALGVIASVATIVRLAYFTAYTSARDYMYGVANIALWTVVECGIGIAGGSVATFRPLLRMIPFLSHSSYAEQSGPLGGASRSQHLDDLSRSRTFANRSKLGPEETADPWERSDAESQKHILKETTFDITHEGNDIPSSHFLERNDAVGANSKLGA